ncbi:uncharacterized protein H6S33_007566 [Morchella sextelata]|uniref:uncharacterized protein n=1 Tax=Morchella sextelata TaxID=1174677 RepID=UPI001D04C6D1|nr:uncharacterized protein H6S33_007566 [Morchella sextelata]KAH0603907.1 hypothetical protein H6S33_007566 [Morchella sextelata]
MSAQEINQATFLEGYNAGYRAGFPTGFLLSSMQAAINTNAAPVPSLLLSAAPPTIVPTAAPMPLSAAPRQSGWSRQRQRRRRRKARESAADMSVRPTPKRQTGESGRGMPVPAPKRQIEESDRDVPVPVPKRRCLTGPAATVVPTAPVASAGSLVPAAPVVQAAPVVRAAPAVRGPSIPTTNYRPVEIEAIDGIERWDK